LNSPARLLYLENAMHAWLASFRRAAAAVWWPCLVVGAVGLLVTCVFVLPRYLVDRTLGPAPASRLSPVERLKAANDDLRPGAARGHPGDPDHLQQFRTIIDEHTALPDSLAEREV
jgi:hypothetical protein